MQSMVDSLAMYTDEVCLIRHVQALQAYMVSKRGTVLNAYVTVLRNCGAADAIAYLESDRTFGKEAATEIENLKMLLSRTSRLWDVNLHILSKNIN